MDLPALQPSSGWYTGHLTAPFGNWMLGVVDHSAASAVVRFPHPDIHVLSLTNRELNFMVTGRILTGGGCKALPLGPRKLVGSPPDPAL